MLWTQACCTVSRWALLHWRQVIQFSCDVQYAICETRCRRSDLAVTASSSQPLHISPAPQSENKYSIIYLSTHLGLACRARPACRRTGLLQRRLQRTHGAAVVLHDKRGLSCALSSTIAVAYDDGRRARLAQRSLQQTTFPRWLLYLSGGSRKGFLAAAWHELRSVPGCC